MVAARTANRFTVKRLFQSRRALTGICITTTNNLTHQLSQVASQNTWGHRFYPTQMKLFALSRSHTITRDWKRILKSGCYRSGNINIAVNLSGCSNVDSRTAEHSFGSTSQPAGFLQLFRIAEIYLLSLHLGTDSVKAAGSLLLARFPFLLSVCLFLSVLLAHHSLLF